MKTLSKAPLLGVIIYLIILLALNNCGGGGGGGGGGSSMNPSPNPNPNPATQGSLVNLGDISTIPLNGNMSNTSIVLTNNLNDSLLLIGATYTLSSGGNAFAPLNALNQSPLSVYTPGSPINVSQCTTVGPRGVCNVMVQAPAGSENSDNDDDLFVNRNRFVESDDEY